MHEYFYNENNALDLILQSDDFTDSSFVETHYDYHSYGSLEQEQKYSTNNDPNNPLWYGQFRKVYEHDENYSSSKIRFPRTKFSGSFFDQAHYFENHMLLRELHYVDGGNPPERIESSAKHFYSEIIMTNSEVIKPSVSNEIFLAPNPSSNIISI